MKEIELLMKKKKKLRLKIKNLFWVWIIIGVVLFAGNLTLALVGKYDIKSDILTVISGWVGGIATIFLGLVAFKQNKDYTLFVNKQGIVDMFREEYNRLLSCVSKYSNFNFLTEFILELQWNEFTKKEDDIKELYFLRKCNGLLNVVNQGANEIQTFDYIPLEKKAALVKTIELIDYINKNYYDLIKYANYRNKLHDKIMEIIEDMNRWADEFHKIKMAAKEDINLKIKEVNAYKNMKQLQSLLEDISIKNATVNEEIEKFREEHNSQKL